MKSSTSVILLGPLLFILMAFAIYIFHSFPYLLALVLLAEWIAVAMTVFGPAFDGKRSGWLSRVLLVLIGLGFANLYMLFLGRQWGVDPAGWYRFTLHWQDGAIGFVTAFAKFVVSFFDDLIKAVFNTGNAPIQSSISKLGSGAGLGELTGSIGRLPVLPYLLVGAIGSLMSASVLKGLLAKSKGGSGGGGGHH